MEKNYEKNPEKANDIKKQLYDKYQEEIFKKYGINEASLSRMQVCNLAEFLIAEHPENYDKTQGRRMDYENNENLQKIYAVIDKKENRAILINTNENGKVPEGEFGTYEFGTENLKEPIFNPSEEIKKSIKETIRKMSNKTLTEKEIEEMTNEISPKNLDDMDKIATMGQRHIDKKVRKAVDQKIDDKNQENGKTKEERKKLEEENKNKKNDRENSEQKEEEEQEKNSLVSPEMLKQAYVLGYTKIKGVVVAKGADASNKLEGTAINKNAGNVTILRLAGDSVGKENDKYLVFQDNRLVVPGNKDEQIDALLGRRMQSAKDGTLVAPLEIEDQEQYLEYNKDGMSIDIKLKEGKDMSVEDLEEYKKEFKKIMEKFSIKLYKIENDPLKTDAERDKLYIQANQEFNLKNEDISQKCNINFDDMKEVNLVTDKRAQEQVDKEQGEPEAWEVPGKRERGN